MTASPASAPAFIPAHALQWWPDFVSAQDLTGVPARLLAAQAQVESSWDPNAESAAGAQGLMQLEPAFYPNVNPFDPAAAIRAAGESMAAYHSEFGTWRAALAAYNEGPGNYRTYGISNAQTTDYVARVGALYGDNLDA